MKRLAAAIVCLILAGCLPDQSRPVNMGQSAVAAAHPQADFSFRVITIPRSHFARMESLWRYTDPGGARGVSPQLLGMNGVRMAKVDMRFRDKFLELLAAMRGANESPQSLRLYEGQEQAFEIGPAFNDETLFIWKTPDEVVGAHFERARYRMKLALTVTPDSLADVQVSWSVSTGAFLNVTVNLPIETHVTLEKDQPLVIAPADLSGRGVGHALLGAGGEAASNETLLVITPTLIQPKAQPPAPPRAGTVRDDPYRR